MLWEETMPATMSAADVLDCSSCGRNSSARFKMLDCTSLASMQRSRPTLVRSSLCEVQGANQELIQVHSRSLFACRTCCWRILHSTMYMITYWWYCTWYLLRQCVCLPVVIVLCFQDSEATRVLQQSNDQTFMVPEVLLGNHRFCTTWKSL